MTVAALYVHPRGVYAELAAELEVHLWTEDMDARRYVGPHPVVAHPPCSAWCQLAHVNQARYGNRVGDDGGCFAAALGAVRLWGGVLEHPAHSHAWRAFGLTAPPTSGGWHAADWYGGWTCYVEQAQFGHQARKGSWLYVHGVELAELPTLPWGWGARGDKVVSYSRNRGSEGRERLPRIQAQATPRAFAELLVGIARGATWWPEAEDLA